MKKLIIISSVLLLLFGVAFFLVRQSDIPIRLQYRKAALIVAIKLQLPSANGFSEYDSDKYGGTGYRELSKDAYESWGWVDLANGKRATWRITLDDGSVSYFELNGVVVQ